MAPWMLVFVPGPTAISGSESRSRASVEPTSLVGAIFKTHLHEGDELSPGWRALPWRGSRAQAPVRAPGTRCPRGGLGRIGRFTVPGQHASRYIRYPMCLMKRLRSHRARRLPTLIAAIALFLTGSNYCMLSALAGDTRMACLATPGDASEAAVPACHRAAARTPSDTKPPAATPSCCPDPVVAPLAPTIDKSDGAITLPPHALVATLDSPASPAVIDRHGPPPAADAEPPPRFAHAPVPARAPPLA